MWPTNFWPAINLYWPLDFWTDYVSVVAFVTYSAEVEITFVATAEVEVL